MEVLELQKLSNLTGSNLCLSLFQCLQRSHQGFYKNNKSKFNYFKHFCTKICTKLFKAITVCYVSLRSGHSRKQLTAIYWTNNRPGKTSVLSSWKRICCIYTNVKTSRYVYFNGFQCLCKKEEAMHGR